MTNCGFCENKNWIINYNVWPQKPFQQSALEWRIFVSSFIVICPVSKENHITQILLTSLVTI